MDGAAGLRGRRRACLVAAALLGALIVSCRRHEPEGPVLTVLLTGFEPFGPYKINSSWESIKDIAADAVAGARIKAVQLPVDHAGATRRLDRELRGLRPDVVICFGMAAGRKAVSLELEARNLDRERAAEGSGAKWRECPIVCGGSETYGTSLHVEGIRAALRDAGIPVRRSRHAGRYVCNHVFYRLMHATRRGQTSAGFVHLPAIRSKQVERGLTRRQLRRTVMTVVRAELAAIRGEEGGR